MALLFLYGFGTDDLGERGAGKGIDEGGGCGVVDTDAVSESVALDGVIGAECYVE